MACRRSEKKRRDAHVDCPVGSWKGHGEERESLVLVTSKSSGKTELNGKFILVQKQNRKYVHSVFIINTFHIILKSPRMSMAAEEYEFPCPDAPSTSPQSVNISCGDKKQRQSLHQVFCTARQQSCKSLWQAGSLHLAFPSEHVALSWSKAVWAHSVSSCHRVLYQKIPKAQIFNSPNTPSIPQFGNSIHTHTQTYTQSC